MKLPGWMALAWTPFRTVTVQAGSRLTTAGPEAWVTVSFSPSSAWTGPRTWTKAGAAAGAAGAGWAAAGSASAAAQAATVSETICRRMMMMSRRSVPGPRRQPRAPG